MILMKKSLKQTFVLCGAAVLSGVIGYGPAVGQLTSGRSAPAPAPHTVETTAPSGAAERALLDQYCVTCHNDKLKTANFSLQKLDLATVGDHPELWERVVRKLRAGLMPPPGMRRPPL